MDREKKSNFICIGCLSMNPAKGKKMIEFRPMCICIIKGSLVDQGKLTFFAHPIIKCHNSAIIITPLSHDY